MRRGVRTFVEILGFGFGTAMAILRVSYYLREIDSRLADSGTIFEES